MLKSFRFYSSLLDILGRDYKGWSHSIFSLVVLAAKNVFLSHIEWIRLREDWMHENHSEEELKFFNAVANAFTLMPKEARDEIRVLIRKFVRS